MRIDNSYLFGPKAGEVQGNQETGASSPAGDVQLPQAPEVDVHVQSPELAQLRQLLRQSPETRVGVLAQVAQRLAAGYYTTPNAAQQTAQAILDAVD